MTKINYNRIKAALAKKGITNKELADALKIAPETVSSWCTNTAQPSIKRLFDVATFWMLKQASYWLAGEKDNI